MKTSDIQEKKTGNRGNRAAMLGITAAIAALTLPACDTTSGNQGNNAYGNPGQTDPYNPYYSQPATPYGTAQSGQIGQNQSGYNSYPPAPGQVNSPQSGVYQTPQGGYQGQPYGNSHVGAPAYPGSPAGGSPGYGPGNAFVEDVSSQQGAYNPPPSSSPRTHVVQSGDTLWRLSQQYGTTVEAIKQANGMPANSDTIITGSSINIP